MQLLRNLKICQKNPLLGFIWEKIDIWVLFNFILIGVDGAGNPMGQFVYTSFQ